MTSDTLLRRAVTALLLINVVGFLVAVLDDLAPFAPATVLNGSKVSTPAVILVPVVIGTVLGTARSRPRLGAAITALPAAVSVMAGLFDGDLAHAGVSGAEIAIQAAIIATTATILVLSVLRLARPGAASPLAPIDLPA